MRDQLILLSTHVVCLILNVPPPLVQVTRLVSAALRGELMATGIARGRRFTQQVCVCLYSSETDIKDRQWKTGANERGDTLNA